MNAKRRLPSVVILGALIGLTLVAVAAFPAVQAAAAAGVTSHPGGGEASLKVPDLGQVRFVGLGSRTILMAGLLVCALGFLFGLVTFGQIKRLPVHPAMREISELIYETCKTYLITQGKLLLILEVFVGFIIVLYFGTLLRFEAIKVIIILLFSVIGIGGSYSVAWFGIRINTFANSRTAFASLAGNAFLLHAIPLKAGMSIGMLLISVELLLMLLILLFIPGDYAGPCFIGFAIGESLGAAALRIAGGILASSLTARATTPATPLDPPRTVSRPTGSRAWRSSPSSSWLSEIPSCRCNCWSGSS